MHVSDSMCVLRGPRSSAEDAALGEALVASKREEMDREIDHLLITQSENLRRYWEVSLFCPCLSFYPGHACKGPC